MDSFSALGPRPTRRGVESRLIALASIGCRPTRAVAERSQRPGRLELGTLLGNPVLVLPETLKAVDLAGDGTGSASSEPLEGSVYPRLSLDSF